MVYVKISIVFDKAKAGYVNLLTSAKQAVKNAGDDVKWLLRETTFFADKTLRSIS